MDSLQQNLWGVSHQALLPKAPQAKSKIEKQVPRGERHEEAPSFKLDTILGINQSTTVIESAGWILSITQIPASFCRPHGT